jgi:hypothetical protein
MAFIEYHVFFIVGERRGERRKFPSSGNGSSQLGFVAFPKLGIASVEDCSDIFEWLGRVVVLFYK